MRKNILPVFLLTFLCINFIPQFKTYCQDESSPFDHNQLFTLKQLKEDYSLLRTALEEAHAGLYYYSTKEEMDKYFEKTFENLIHSMTEFEFYRHLALLIAEINDGHTGVLFSQNYNRQLSEESILIPFNFKFIKEKGYIFRNYSSDENLDLGGELISINDLPFAEISKKMLPYVPSDGHIETSKFKRLQNTEYFGRLFSLIFGKTTNFKIVYKSHQDKTQKKIEVSGIKSTEMNRLYNQRYPEADQNRPPIKLAYKENVAILSIKTFSDGPYQSFGTPFYKFLKSAFIKISEKKIQYLIIDLRGNGGGADVNGKLLFSYLIDKPYMFYNYLEIRNNEFSFLEHTDAPEMGKIIKFRAKENDRGTFYFQMHFNLGEQKPLQPTYKGKVYVIIDGRSFSGSGETTSMMHFHKRAVFIGEECGAGYYGNTSGFMPTLTLPNTKLRVRIPMMRYVMAVSDYQYPDRGIIPDYPFQRTIEDYLNDKDTELEFVFKLIKKQN